MHQRSMTNCICVKSVCIRSYSGQHFSRIFTYSNWIQRDTPYLSVFSANSGKSGQMRTRITPNTDTFYAVCIWSHLLKKSLIGNFIFSAVCKPRYKKMLWILKMVITSFWRRIYSKEWLNRKAWFSRSILESSDQRYTYKFK